MEKQNKKKTSRGFKNSKSNSGELLSSFDHYLDRTKGLATITRKYYLGYIRSFLQIQFNGKIDISSFQGKDVVDFVLSYKEQGSNHRAQAMTYALRSFFRFLFQARIIKEDLASYVPSIRVPEKTTFPEFLKPDELQMLLDSCDRSQPKGLRDYAVLLLLIQLGLRSSEVCYLTLDDIDWNNGEITIRGKGSVSRFPLYQDLGDAIIAYLSQGRPKCSSRALFISFNKFHRNSQSSSVRHILRTALKRAGLNPKKKGAHLIRHSFAMELLRQGASLYEIAAVLRHKNIGTTAIYAKVNFEKLAEIAAPWPLDEMKGGKS